MAAENTHRQELHGDRKLIISLTASIGDGRNKGGGGKKGGGGGGGLKLAQVQKSRTDAAEGKTETL